MCDLRIVPAYDRIGEIKEIFREYVEKECVANFGIELEFQNITEELENPQKKYDEMTGGLYLVLWKSGAAGCIAFQKMDQTRCEIKRLYIRQEYRGNKLGERAMEFVLEEARKKNYKEAYCDTLSRMASAVALYNKLGFVEIEPYYQNPFPDALFLKKVL